MHELVRCEQVIAPHIHIGRFVEPAVIDVSTPVRILLVVDRTGIVLGMKMFYVNGIEVVLLQHYLVSVVAEGMALRARGIFVYQPFYPLPRIIVDGKGLVS